MKRRRHPEHHRTDHIGWLRASVLGANDGIVSTASLIVGVAASGASLHGVITTGVAGWVAGAMSMAAGEYVSVHSQADTENADLRRERTEIDEDPAAEQRELAGIYVRRGLTPALAQQVAQQLMRHDALGAHARDELGISPTVTARPVQAALASAPASRSAPCCPCWSRSWLSGPGSCRWYRRCRCSHWPCWACCRPGSAAPAGSKVRRA